MSAIKKIIIQYCLEYHDQSHNNQADNINILT